MPKPKIIQYYRKLVYGNDYEYVIDQKDAESLRYLTGKKTTTPGVREHVTLIAGGLVTFQEVVPPKEAK